MAHFSTPLDEAITQFNQRNWYRAHDAFEELWYSSEGELRAYLHALIQIAVAEYHLENNNHRGSMLLMAEGLNHLQGLSPSDFAFDPQTLTHVVARRLFALQHGLATSEIPLPMISKPC